MNLFPFDGLVFILETLGALLLRVKRFSAMPRSTFFSENKPLEQGRLQCFTWKYLTVTGFVGFLQIKKTFVSDEVVKAFNRGPYLRMISFITQRSSQFLREKGKIIQAKCRFSC